MKMEKLLKIIIVMSLIFLPSLIIAGGTNFNSIRSSKALSLGGLYYSGADGISAIYSNPANLADLKYSSFEFSYLDKVHEYNYKSEEGKSYKSFNKDAFNISLGGAYKISNDITIGLGYYNVFDYEISWPYITILRNSTNSSVQPFTVSQNLNLNSAAVAASYKTNNFSLGISANVLILKNIPEFYQTNPQWQNNLGLSGYQFKYNQDALGFSVNLGINYYVNENMKMSFLIKQGTSFTLDGDAETLMLSDLDSAKSIVGVTSEFEIPWSFGLGFLYEINENWKFNCDLSYSLWGGINKNIGYEFDDVKWRNFVFQPDSISGFDPRNQTLDFENVLEAGLGIEYYNPSGVSLRAGYKYSASQNSTKSYSFLMPNTDEHWLTAGIGFNYENFTIDAAIAVVIGIETEIKTSDNNYFPGRYNSYGYYPSFNINYKF